MSFPVLVSPECNLAFSEPTALNNQSLHQLSIITILFRNTLQQRIQTRSFEFLRSQFHLHPRGSNLSNTAGWQFHISTTSLYHQIIKQPSWIRYTNKNPAGRAVNTSHGGPELQVGRGVYFPPTLSTNVSNYGQKEKVCKDDRGREHWNGVRGDWPGTGKWGTAHLLG